MCIAARADNAPPICAIESARAWLAIDRIFGRETLVIGSTCVSTGTAQRSAWATGSTGGHTAITTHLITNLTARGYWFYRWCASVVRGTRAAGGTADGAARATNFASGHAALAADFMTGLAGRSTHIVGGTRGAGGTAGAAWATSAARKYATLATSCVTGCTDSLRFDRGR